MSRITQYERCSLLAVKTSHKTVGCFLHFINGPADDLQYRCGVKILLHHGRKHEGKQDARKFLAAELLSKCVWPDLFVPGQHHGQRIQDVLPGLPHLLLAISGVLPHEAERVMGEEAGVLLRAVLHLPVHPADAGESILKHRRVGAAAAIIWAVFNSLACIFFGLFAEYIPTVRRIMQSKVMFYFIGFLTVFQTWTQMSGIYEIFGDTPIGTTGGTLIVYGTCLVFLFMLLKEGMIRNVLSDGFSWVVVYGLLAVVVIAALVYTHGAFVNIDPGLTAAGIQTGLYKGFLLLPGPFTYPYYYSLFSYNDKNEDGTQHGNMKKSFVLAGVMFGVYMVLAALLTWVNFSPLLNTLKAILITIIALSSLSTYLYSEYLVFGENIGFLIDVLTVTSWQLVIPLGVMGIWTLMSELRVYIIIFVLLASVVLHLVSDRKEDAR